jgi:leader peptidase (prepilin peptidase) / N-methyltransferase
VSRTLIRLAIAVPYGLMLGSFMTVVVSRMPRKESIVKPGSHCPSCGTPVRWWDNIPVISWALLRGKCRACGSRISIEYPLIELTTAALVIAAVFRFSDPWRAGLIAAFLSMMPAIALIDIRHRIIPNRLMYPAFGLAAGLIVVARLAGGDVDPLRAAIGALAFGGGLLVVALLSGGMGMGDVKLAAVIGLVLGALGLRYVAVSAAAAIAFGGLGGIVALAMGRGRKSAIPFGPYLAAGAVVAAFWGQRLADLYLKTAKAG